MRMAGVVAMGVAAGVALTACETLKGGGPRVKLMTLDPGHFHAALVQKAMYPGVDPMVCVYAPAGQDVQDHLAKIQGYNARTNDPTRWQEKVYTGPDYLEKMLAEKPGNVVVISGNNAKKSQYILRSVQAGLNVLADKPMAIQPSDFAVLREAFDTAAKNGVLLYDIMTERSEITTVLQRELSGVPAVFGTQEKGTAAQPAVTKESVHHFFKTVSGSPLKRPAWFYDVRQQGEGIVDVTTHLVDLVQWECFPGQVVDWQKDIAISSARRWATTISPEQFKRSTQQDTFPDYLKKDVGADGRLNVYANGEINYTVKGVHAKVSVTWNFEAPPGGGDTHYSIMRGTRANLIIRQGAEQNYKPTLYIEPLAGADVAAAVDAAVAKLQKPYPGVAVKKIAAGWEVVIPDSYKVGHEAHFAQVTERYLKYLADGQLPAWEVPNMIAKYYTTTKAFELSR
jgi:predicted dehydrogenase